MAVKIGEVTSEMTTDVKKTEDMKALLRVGYSDKSEGNHIQAFRRPEKGR